MLPERLILPRSKHLECSRINVLAVTSAPLCKAPRPLLRAFFMSPRNRSPRTRWELDQLPVLNVNVFVKLPVAFVVIAGFVPELIGLPLLKSFMVVFVPATVTVYSVFGSSG